MNQAKVTATATNTFEATRLKAAMEAAGIGSVKVNAYDQGPYAIHVVTGVIPMANILMTILPPGVEVLA